MHSSPGFATFRFRSSIARDATRIVTFSRLASIFTLALLASLGACSDAMAAPPGCEQYPIPWQPAEEARTAARTELASLSPGADITWNANTGTLTSALQLATPLPGCTDGQDVNAQVLEVLATHPALFQLDLTEWRVPEPFDCKYLDDFTTINMGRRSLAGRPVAKDVLAYSLKRSDGVVYLTAVNGTYLPVLGAAMDGAMAACNNLTEPVARGIARHASLNAATFSQCRSTGSVTYVPKADDDFRLSPAEEWTWQEDTGQVLLTGQRTLRVTVNPANYTPELMSSDANCPVPDGDGDSFTIGFDIVFDVHTGAIISVKPGLDCIVC